MIVELTQPETGVRVDLQRIILVAFYMHLCAFYRLCLVWISLASLMLTIENLSTEFEAQLAPALYLHGWRGDNTE
jgi:uncharacterized membrane protein